MSAQPQAVTELNLGQLLTWCKVLLNYTDEVVANIPEDDAGLDWRPTDDKGGWYFSIREQAMHIADTRHSALGWITGEDAAAREFCTEYGGTEKPWEFKRASRAEILASLQAGREAVDAWLARPLSAALETTPNLVAEHEKILAQLKADGKDASEREARGPGRIINVIFFIVTHEQSHRSVLQSMLRQRGYEVTRYA